jgi:hypothetical protein
LSFKMSFAMTVILLKSCLPLSVSQCGINQADPYRP